MPCYEVRLMSVEFKIENRKLLDEAIKALGWRVIGTPTENYMRLSGGVVIDFTNGQATIQDYQQAKLNELKREYSKQAVKHATKKIGWNVKWSKRETNKATVNKVQW